MTQWPASHLLAATMQLGYRVGPSPRIVLKLCSLRLSSPESLSGQDRGAGRCVRCAPCHRPAACGFAMPNLTACTASRVGDDWAASNSAVRIGVPSVIIPDERNVLINPKPLVCTRCVHAQVRGVP